MDYRIITNSVHYRLQGEKNINSEQIETNRKIRQFETFGVYVNNKPLFGRTLNYTPYPPTMKTDGDVIHRLSLFLANDV